jgi:hypothetical protein
MPTFWVKALEGCWRVASGTQDTGVTRETETERLEFCNLVQGVEEY